MSNAAARPYSVAQSVGRCGLFCVKVAYSLATTTTERMEVRDLGSLSRVLQVGETRRTQVSLSLSLPFDSFILIFYTSNKESDG